MKAPFGLFMPDENKAEEKKRKAKRADERKILKELSKLLNVNENDIPKTLERFKKEIDEMEKGLRS